MKKIVVLVIVLVILAAVVGGLAYADLRVRAMAEEHAEAKIAQVLPQAEGVHVSFDGFPFVLGVLVSGEVEALHVMVDAVQEAGLRATRLRLDVDDIVLDTDALLDEQRLVITDIGRARVEGFVSDDVVGAVAEYPVEFEPGRARVEYRGRQIEASVRVQGRLVALSSDLPEVPPMLVPLPSSALIPCSPEVELLAGQLRLSCSVDEIPPELEEAMAQR